MNENQSEQTDRILEVARRAGRMASVICRRVLAESPATPDAMAKLGKEPVTVADYGSQAAILRAVSTAFPEHGVIAEEGADHLRAQAGDETAQRLVRLLSEVSDTPPGFDEICAWIDHAGPAGAEYTWAIDPIDGTKGFLRRQQYAVAIGVLHRGVPFAGVLACPNLPVDAASPDGARGVLFVAARGRGASREALDAAGGGAVSVSRIEDAADVRVLGSVESAHGDPRVLRSVIEDLALGGGIVRVDSQVKYGVVASGAAEVYLRPLSRPDYRERIWDHAAGMLVVEEAGGRVTDIDGKSLDFSCGSRLENNRGVLATNGRIHDRLLESLARG